MGIADSDSHQPRSALGCSHRRFESSGLFGPFSGCAIVVRPASDKDDTESASEDFGGKAALVAGVFRPVYGGKDVFARPQADMRQRPYPSRSRFAIELDRVVRDTAHQGHRIVFDVSGFRIAGRAFDSGSGQKRSEVPAQILRDNPVHTRSEVPVAGHPLFVRGQAGGRIGDLLLPDIR